MKSKLTFLTSVLAFGCVAWPASAETPKDKDATSSPPNAREGRSVVRRTDRLGSLDKAKDLIGMTVKNSQDETLGEVKDLAIDLKAGRIVQVVVSVGGVLGVGSKHIAVPPGQFTRDSEKKVVRLNVDKERLKLAPEFELSKWDDCCPEPRMVEVYRYYGEEPYFNGVVRSEQVRSALTPLGYVASANKVIGMQVLNNQDEKIGKVDNFLLDLPAGRLVHVVVSSGGFLGLGDELSVIPPAAFEYDAKEKSLRLDVTKQALASAPHFKGSEWAQVDDPAYAGEVYRAYRIQPYFATNAPDADNTARNVRDRDDRSLTPLDQGNSKPDIETTRRIRKDILGREGLSRNARNIKVITVNGRVTLRGPVETEEEKRILEEIATRTSGLSTVENKIEVKTN